MINKQRNIKTIKQIIIKKLIKNKININLLVFWKCNYYRIKINAIIRYKIQKIMLILKKCLKN
jgi:hypothetical protein